MKSANTGVVLVGGVIEIVVEEARSRISQEAVAQARESRQRLSESTPFKSTRMLTATIVVGEGSIGILLHPGRVTPIDGVGAATIL